MVRSQLGGTNPHAPARDVEYTCASTRIVFLLPRFSQVAKTGGNHGGSAKEIPMQMNILTMAHIKSRADQNGNPHTYETQNAVMQKISPNLALWPPHRGASTQEPTWEHKSSRSNAEIANTWTTMLIVSLPQHCTRIAKPAGNHGGLAKQLHCGRTLRQ